MLGYIGTWKAYSSSSTAIPAPVHGPHNHSRTIRTIDDCRRSMDPTNSTKIKKCAGKDNLQRMNYLYQVCNALATKNVPNYIASSMYSNLMVAISKKAVQRLDIDVKRTICKGCRCLMLAGITCKVRIKKKQSIWTCQLCQTRKIFLLKNKNYLAWPLQEGSIVEFLEYKN